MSSVRPKMHFMLKWFSKCLIRRSFLFALFAAAERLLCLPVCVFFEQQILSIIMMMSISMFGAVLRIFNLKTVVGI